jgi:hypothetical protein
MEPSQRWSISIAVFALVTLIGMQMTLTLSKRMVAHLPADDVPEAFYRDGIAAEYVLTGYVLTLVGAFLGSWLAHRRATPRTPEK